MELLALTAVTVPVQVQATNGTVATTTDGRAAVTDEGENLGLVAGRPSVRPVRVDEPPVIDGRLDDEAWEAAALVTDFVQQSPLDGAPATEDTQVHIAYDDHNLYFGFSVYYADPSIMRANRVDRDRATSDDLMTVYLDTFLGQQRGYRFDVNGYGVQGDGIIRAGGAGAVPLADRTWDALYLTGAQLVEHGYTAEMAIPFKSLRYPNRAREQPHQWGLQISRTIQDKNQEHAVWAPMSRDESSFLAQMGVLEGMTDLSAGRTLELLPTVTAVRLDAFDPPTGGLVNQSTSQEGGLNIKYGLTSNMTADFTIKPEYSQIESDRPQIDVNQRFPLFFPELRPFFLEGAEIFLVGGPVASVHTRTIVDPLYGAKLTGRAGHTSLGVLVASDEAPGNVGDPTDPAFGQTAQTIIGRVKYDLYAESHVGGIFTNREFLDSYSRLGLLDGHFRLGPTHAFGYRVAGTQHRDLNDVERTGHLLDLDFRKRGRNVSYSMAAFSISPAFRTDTGFVQRTDQRRAAGNVAYRWWPEHWVINWGSQLDYGRTYDFDNLLHDENVAVRVDVNLVNNILIEADLSRDMERFAGIEFFKKRYAVGGGMNTSRRFALGGRFSTGDQIFYDSETPYLGHGSGMSLYLTLRPMSRLQSDLSLDTSRFAGPVTDRKDDFDLQILRVLSTYQLTERFVLRNITQFNTLDETLDLNLLVTYRVNGGTVFFVGYDDHYQQIDRTEGNQDGGRIEDSLVASTRLGRTNRAVFMKLQYLFRY